MRASSLRAQVQFIGAGVVRRVGRRRRRTPASGTESASATRLAMSSWRLKQVAHRRLYRVRCEQRAARRLDELRRGAQLIARAQQRAEHDAIDVGLCRKRLEIGSVAGEARGDGARSQDQRADGRERRRDRIGQAEGEEIGFGVRPQDAKRQDDESRQRPGQRRRGAVVRARDAREAPPPSPPPMAADRPAAWPARDGSRGPPRQRPGSPSGLVVARSTWRG